MKARLIRASFFLVFLTLIFGFLWFQGNKEYGLKFNWITGILCVLSFFSATMLSYSLASDGVSLRVIYWFYSFFFLGIIPIFQHSTGLWRFSVPDWPIPYAVAIIFVGHVSFIIGYKKGVLKQKFKIRPTDKPIAVREVSVPRLILATFISTCITLTLIAIYGFNPSGSVVREAFGYQFGPVESITEFLVRPTIFFLLLIMVFRLRGQKKSAFIKIILVVLLINILLIISPIAGNRSMIFFLYFGLLVLAYPPTPKRSFFYMFVLTFGIVGSHFQSEFRSFFSTAEINAFSVAYLFQGHFDGFENLCHIISYTSIHGIVWGWQLLGSIFFYIPRVVWPSKPTGSGDFIAWNYLDSRYVVFDGNIATPLTAEAFLNFHIVGVMIFLFFCGYICSVLDKRYKYLYQLIEEKKMSFIELGYSHLVSLIFYPVLLGLFLFILRGDLMSGTTFLVGMIISFSLSIFLTTRKRVIIIKQD